MKLTQFWILLFVFASLLSHAQQGEKPEIQEKLIPLVEWFKNPLTQDFHPSILTELRDTGVTTNGLKEGYWVTYFVDASLVGQKMKYMIGDQEQPVSMPPNLAKETGNYVKGNREGEWSYYSTMSPEAPFHWYKNSVMHYKNGLREGEEIIYQTVSENKQMPVIVRIWKADMVTGGRKYYDEAPYGLQRTYTSKDDNLVYMRSYFPTGVPQEALDDTTINGQQSQYLKEFYPSGKLKQIGFYQNGKRSGTYKAYYESGNIQTTAEYANEERNGSYKVFYESGLLWTERIYQNDKLMEVTVNHSKVGKKQDPGTIKNGTGTVNVYDADGKLLQTVQYVDGKEVERK